VEKRRKKSVGKKIRNLCVLASVVGAASPLGFVTRYYEVMSGEIAETRPNHARTLLLPRR
jgi:hypothetical protein